MKFFPSYTVSSLAIVHVTALRRATMLKYILWERGGAGSKEGKEERSITQGFTFFQLHSCSKILEKTPCQVRYNS